MIIHVVNRDHSVSSRELRKVITAINKQIRRDFVPYWGMPCTVRPDGAVPLKRDLPDIQDACMLYLQKNVNEEDLLGYHDRTAAGIPFGVVSLQAAEELEEPWSVTFSHEVLELIGDPHVNLLAMGPHPKTRGRDVLHWFEMCDAVQAETYEIDGVAVSNFVLPFYFTFGEEGPNDFMNNGVKSFRPAAGGYVGFYDPSTKREVQYAPKSDRVAHQRMVVKAALGPARRSQRYKMSTAERVKKKVVASPARLRARLRQQTG